ncbi:techylectin-5A-like [Saccostrea echinata]|uniref:techylectin-5A-like n=1 Tax=Saccostrea echinata TaxID=191078 RepID=UPI002A831C99|nr:techylectin-5A-like [Saccostrea echinata]
MKMNIALLVLFLLPITVETIKDTPNHEGNNQCVTEMNSFRTLLNLASHLVNLQQANCNKSDTATSAGIMSKENNTEWATKQDIREINQKLASIYDLLRDCRKDISKTFYPKDCQDLLLKGYRENNVYTIYPNKGSGFQVYCDQKTDGGGWTVIQRRRDGSENFFRTWNDYKNGFGNLSNEFWLGNEKIHKITQSGKYKLRIDMTDFSRNSRHASYNTFNVGNEKAGYILHVSGYSGDAGDSFSSRHNGAKFVTKDRDDKDSCAKEYKGGWWYKSCHRSNLNGLYLKGKHKSYADGVNWYHWMGYYYSLKFTEMKIRK